MSSLASPTNKWTPYEDNVHKFACMEFFEGLYAKKLTINNDNKELCFQPIYKSWGEFDAEEYSQYHAKQFLLKREHFNLYFFNARSREICRRDIFKNSEGREISNLFFSLIQSKIPTLFLEDEKFSYLPHNFNIVKNARSLDHALRELKFPLLSGKKASSGMELLPRLSDTRFKEFMAELQDIFKKENVATRPFPHLGKKLSLPAWRLLYRACFIFEDVKESAAFNELVQFSTASEDNFKFFFSNSEKLISSFQKNPQYFSQAVRDLRREIYSVWATKDADTFKKVLFSQNNPDYNMPDMDIAVAPFTKKILENACSAKESLFFLQSLFAPHFKGPIEEFFSSPDFSEANRQFQNSFEHPFYGNVFKGLFGKDITSDYFERLEKELNVPINKNLQVNEPFFPSKAFLRRNFEKELYTILKSPTPTQIYPSIFNQFIESNTADTITIIHRLRTLLLKEQDQQIKIGYVSYDGLPLAAWRFLHGKPYPAENFTWQELFDMVYERFTKEGSLEKFLVIFRYDTQPNLINDKLALRIEWTCQAIVGFHSFNHPEDCLKAIDQELILDTSFAEKVRKKIIERNPNISFTPSIEEKTPRPTPQITPSQCTTETPMANGPAVPPPAEDIPIPQPSPPPENASGKETSSLVITSDDFDEEISNLKIKDFLPKSQDRNFPGTSDKYAYLLNLLVKTPMSNPDWPAYFKEFFEFFQVSDEQITECLNNHQDCVTLHDADAKLTETYNSLVQNGKSLFQNLHNLPVVPASMFEDQLNEFTFCQASMQSFAIQQNVPFMAIPCIKLCLFQTQVLRQLENGQPIDDVTLWRYERNKTDIPATFEYLKSWIIIQKCDFIKRGQFLKSHIASLEWCIEYLTELHSYYQNAQANFNRSGYEAQYQSAQSCRQTQTNQSRRY